MRGALALLAMALLGLMPLDAAAAVQGLQQESIRAIFVESGDGVVAGASNCSSVDAPKACFAAASYTGWAAEIAMEVIPCVPCVPHESLPCVSLFHSLSPSPSLDGSLPCVSLFALLTGAIRSEQVLERLGKPITVLSPANFSAASSAETDVQLRCAQEVNLGLADVCVGEFVETAALRQLAPFSLSLTSNPIVLVTVPRTDGARNIKTTSDYFTAPFGWELWLLIPSTLAVASVLMWIIERNVPSGDFPPTLAAPRDDDKPDGDRNGEDQEADGKEEADGPARSQCWKCHVQPAIGQILVSMWLSVMGFLSR